MRRASPCGHASKSESAPPSGAAADGSPCDAFEASRAHARPRRTPFVICTARQPRPGHGHRTVSGESQDGRTTKLQAGAGLGTGAAHQVTRTRPRATRASRNLRACPLPPAPCPCHCQRGLSRTSPGGNRFCHTCSPWPVTPLYRSERYARATSGHWTIVAGSATAHSMVK